jgi:hypothetical protein
VSGRAAGKVSGARWIRTLGQNHLRKLLLTSDPHWGKPVAGIVHWLVRAAVLASCALFGQTAPPPPAFEVASVKPAAPEERAGISGGPGTSDPGLFRCSSVTLRTLLLRAYGWEPFQLLGPSSLDADRYSIVATVPPGATKNQFNQMLQGLLVGRFGLAFHHEMKNMAYYELVVAKSGLKMKEAETALETPAAGGASAASGGPTSIPLMRDRNGVTRLVPGRRGVFGMETGGRLLHRVKF